jgi:hypothetical protein
VANLGISNFLISGIHVRTQDIKEFHYSTQDIVESGKIAELSLPREVCADHPLSIDLEITLECVGLDIHSKTEPQCFNVNMGLDEIPSSVKSGIHGLWSLICPKCNKGFGGLLLMAQQGLKTFDEAFARKKEALKDFQDSCPNHDSKWLLKMDEVENRRRHD